MRVGRELDATIALTIMGLKAVEPEHIPKYSSDIFAAHKIISKLQTIGWFCNVGSRIGNDGSLFYRARFFQNGRECERFADTIPMALCTASLAVIKDEYFEYVDILKDNDDDSPIDIIPSATTGFSKIDADDDISDIVQQVMLKHSDVHPNWNVITKSLIDDLREKNYIIIKKPS